MEEFRKTIGGNTNKSDNINQNLIKSTELFSLLFENIKPSVGVEFFKYS